MAFAYGRPPRQTIVAQTLGRSVRVAILALLVLVLGVTGFSIIEGWSVSEALYMTVITITTVGFGEVQPLHPAGRYFTIFLIFCGVGIWAYTFGSLSKIILEGQFGEFFYRRRSAKMIDSLKNHIIVCGFGRMGRLVSREIAEEGTPFVVIEKRPSLTDDLSERGYHHLNGDATEEDVLDAAGVKRARSLITVLHSDADNVYVVLTARALNPDLHIICRAESPGSADKMLRAGATKVISPYEIGGRSLAQAALRPGVLSFFEMTTTRHSESLGFEELLVPEGSPLVGKTLLESRVRERFGVSVVACRTIAGEMVINPPPDQAIEADSVLLVLGRAAGLKGLSDACLSPAVGER